MRTNQLSLPAYGDVALAALAQIMQNRAAGNSYVPPYSSEGCAHMRLAIAFAGQTATYRWALKQLAKVLNYPAP